MGQLPGYVGSKRQTQGGGPNPCSLQPSLALLSLRLLKRGEGSASRGHLPDNS